MMRKRTKAAAAAAMALAMLCGALPVVPGGAELLNTPLTAHAAGSVTLDEETGVLTLSGAVTKAQIWAYQENDAVESVVAAEGCVLPADCSWLFHYDRAYREYGPPDFDQDYWEFLSEIDFSKADTSRVTDMSYMFGRSAFEDYFGGKHYILRGLDHFDTSNVTDMAGMFLNSPWDAWNMGGLSSFDTSNVTDMNSMFYGCEYLTALDVSSFDTSNVTDMSCMFYGCEDLTALDVSSFDTSNVTDMAGMFSGCNKLTSLNLSSFDTSNVTNMMGMFRYCDKLTALNLSSFDTSNVTGMGSMFYWCSNLTSLDLSSFDTSNVTDMSDMFSGCIKLASLDLSSFDTSNVTNMEYMFSSCKTLETIAVSDLWNTDAVTKSDDMFKYCAKLKGGKGTAFDETHTDKEYARIDGGTGAPGYFTDFNTYINSMSYTLGGTVELADSLYAVIYVDVSNDVKTAVLDGVRGEIVRTDPKPLGTGDYKGYVKLMYPVNATEVRHKITLRLYDEDGKQLPIYNTGYRRVTNDTLIFSVQDYIEQVPQHYPNDEKAQKLAAALDNYCKAASNYFCGRITRSRASRMSRSTNSSLTSSRCTAQN